MHPDTGRIEGWKVDLLALPVCLIGVILSKLLVLPDMLLWYFVTIPLHEMGHAVAAWLAGRFAFPLGALIPMAGFTSVTMESSIVVRAFVVAALVYVFVAGKKNASVFLLGTASIGLAAVAYLSVRVARPESFEFWMVFGGVGGEFAISTILILAFYYRFPESWHWDFFRLPALFYGTYGFASAGFMWWKISNSRQAIPWGTFMSGGGDAGGDMERLARVWTTPQIVGNYFLLAKWCAFLIVVHYGFKLLSYRLASRQ